MSDKCIFQTDQPEINEARCTIPLVLQPKHLEKYCSTGYESWLCEYREKENECPIVKAYEEYAEKYHEDSCADCDHEDMEDPIRQCAEDAYS